MGGKGGCRHGRDDGVSGQWCKCFGSGPGKASRRRDPQGRGETKLTINLRGVYASARSGGYFLTTSVVRWGSQGLVLEAATDHKLAPESRLETSPASVRGLQWVSDARRTPGQPSAHATPR